MTDEQLLCRYQRLVDKKFLGGLTPAEEAEKERLGREIDASFDGFYRPIIERLEGEVADGSNLQ